MNNKPIKKQTGYFCPVCDKRVWNGVVIDSKRPAHCMQCGKKLDWNVRE